MDSTVGLDTASRGRRRGWLLTALLFLAGVGGVGLWAIRFDVSPTDLKQMEAAPGWLIPATLCLTLPFLVHTVRYKLMLDRVVRLSWRFVLDMVFACSFLNHFVVAKIGDFAEPSWIRQRSGLDYWTGLRVGLLRAVHSAVALAVLAGGTLWAWAAYVTDAPWRSSLKAIGAVSALGSLTAFLVAVVWVRRWLNAPYEQLSRHADDPPLEPSTPDTGHPLPDARFSIPESRPPASDARSPIPDTRDLIPDSRDPKPDSRHPIPDSDKSARLTPSLPGTTTQAPLKRWLHTVISTSRRGFHDLARSTADYPLRAHLFLILLAVIEVSVDALPYLFFALAAGIPLGPAPVLTASGALNLIEYIPTPPALLGVQEWAGTLSMLPASVPPETLAVTILVHRTARTLMIALLGAWPAWRILRVYHQRPAQAPSPGTEPGNSLEGTS